MRVKQSFTTPHRETTGKNINKCQIQESSTAKFTHVKVKNRTNSVLT